MRQPTYGKAVDGWKRYARHLGPPAGDSSAEVRGRGLPGTKTRRVWRVLAFRSILRPGAAPSRAPVAAKTDTRIGDAIVTKARQLRRETLKH